MSRPQNRSLTLIATARKNPEFALRVASELQAEAREAFVSELAKPELATRPARPGLVKCVRSPYAPEHGLTAQLSLFARGAARVR
jgi:hypothetical protein